MLERGLGYEAPLKGKLHCGYRVLAAQPVPIDLLRSIAERLAALHN